MLPCFLLFSYDLCENSPQMSDKTVNVRVNVTVRRVRETIVSVEKQ
jgi:hypothetical protein